jgi:hypothetical protein
MNAFLAIVYICALATPVEACDEASAQDVLQVRVRSEMGCMTGWQEVVARSAFVEGIGRDSYLKTRCKRLPALDTPEMSPPAGLGR